MFRAFDTGHGRDVVSLDPVWDGQIEILRGWGRSGRLVCPVCRQAVLLRAGEIMRRHFAHKDLSQCPLGHESAELLAGRAALYAWLNTKFPDGVTLEKNFDADEADECELPRGVDCWVERPGKRNLAYWLVDGKIDPDERMWIPRFIKARNAALNWVFLPRDARRGRLPGRANLSATERELLTPSEFDAVYCEGGGSEGSLHCLDPESQVLTTYRAGLRRVATVLRRRRGSDGIEPRAGPAQHGRIRPSRRVRAFAGRARGAAPARGGTPQGPGGSPTAAGRTGRRGSSRRCSRRRSHRRTCSAAQSPPADRGRAPAKTFDFLAARTSWEKRPATPATIEEPEGTCILCGKRTRDWVVFDTKTGECKCRECLRNQEQGRPTNG